MVEDGDTAVSENPLTGEPTPQADPSQQPADATKDGDKDKKGSKAGGLIACLVFIGIIIGFTIAVSVIYSNRNQELDASQACPTYPEGLTSFNVKVPVAVFWKSSVTVEDPNVSVDSKAVRICPSVKKDAYLYVGGVVAGRTDEKITSTVYKTYLRDCHGDALYSFSYGSPWQVVLKGHTLSVNLVIRSASNEDEILGYASGDQFWNSELYISDASTGQTVVSITKSVLSFTWKVEISNTTSAVADPLLINGIIQKREWVNTKNDNCNKFFWGASIFLIVIASIIALFLCCGVCACVGYITKKGKHGFDDNPSLQQASPTAAPV